MALHCHCHWYVLIQPEDEGCLLKDPLCILMMFSEGKGHRGDTKRANGESLLNAKEPWITHRSYTATCRRLHLNTVANSSSHCKKLKEQESVRQEQVGESASSGTKFTDAFYIRAHHLSAAFWNCLTRKPQSSPQCQQILGQQPISATGFVYFLSRADLRKMETWRGKTGLTMLSMWAYPKVGVSSPNSS